MDYTTYNNLVQTLAEKAATTGSEQTKERIDATILNAQRMKRHDKHSQLLAEIKEKLQGITNQWKWLIITESWCGDGAQNIPIIAKIAQAMPKVSLDLVLRDENIALMDAHLTNGSRSIPKLICYNDKDQEIGNWGPRPVNIQQKVNELKAQQPDISHSELVKNIHLWYAQDKGHSIQNELYEEILKWKNAH